MALVRVRAGDPRRAGGDARVHEEGQARDGVVRAEHRGALDRVDGRGADVALDQGGVLGQVRGGRGLERGLADHAECRAHGGLETLEVHLTVAGHAHDERAALTAVHHRGDHDALERVRGGPRLALARGQLVGDVHERGDGGGDRGVLDLGGGQGRHGGLVQRGGGHRGDGLDVGPVAAVGLDEGVLAHLGGVQELLGAGAAHRTGGGPHRHDLEAESVEDPQVGGPVGLVRGVQAGVVHREGVGVLHDELAPAEQAGARAGLVPVLGLDLVQVRGQVLVRGVQVLHQEREHLLVRGGQEVVVAPAVLQAEQPVAVLVPAPRGLVGLPRQQRREVHLLGADRVHLLAHDPLHLGQHLQAQRQPRVDARGRATDVPGTDEEPVARHLGLRRVVAQGAQEQGGHAQGHDGGLLGQARAVGGGARDGTTPARECPAS